MALAPLTPLNPIARAATKLPSGGPGALEVALQRNQQEDAFVKDALARQKAGEIAAAKQKAATLKDQNKKATEMAKETVFAFHANQWLDKMHGYNDWHSKALQAAAEGKGGDPEDVLSKEYQMAQDKAAEIAQAAKNSKDIEEDYDRNYAAIKNKPEVEQQFKPGAWDRYVDRVKNADINEGTIPQFDASEWDLDNNDAAFFAKVQKEIQAGAHPTADGGVYTFSRKQQVPGSLKNAAEIFTSEPWAYASHLDRYEKLDDGAKKRIDDLAESQKISRATAVALDLATSLYGATEEDAARTQPNSVTGGRKEEADTADEFVKVYKNVFNQDDRKYNFKDAFPEVTDDQISTILVNNPVLKSVLDNSGTDANGRPILRAKPGYHIVTGLNRLAVGETEKTSSLLGSVPGEPKKIQFAIQDEKTGNITIVSATDSEFKAGQMDVGRPLDKHQIIHDVIMPAAGRFGNQYTVRGLEDAFQNNGIDIKTKQTSADNKDVQFKKPAADGARQETAAERYERISGGK